MSAAKLLRNVRESATLTQSKFAEVTGSQQSVISAIESGKRQPQVNTMAAWLNRVGWELIAVPISGPSTAYVGEEIRNAVDANARDSALRAFIRLSNKLRKDQGIDRVMTALVEPQRTNSPEWDAAIAGLVEYWLNRDLLPVPRWVNDPGRFLSQSASPQLGIYDLEPDVSQVPIEFSRRNVLLERATLASV